MVVRLRDLYVSRVCVSRGFGGEEGTVLEVVGGGGRGACGVAKVRTISLGGGEILAPEKLRLRSPGNRVHCLNSMFLADIVDSRLLLVAFYLQDTHSTALDPTAPHFGLSLPVKLHEVLHELSVRGGPDVQRHGHHVLWRDINLIIAV